MDIARATICSLILLASALLFSATSQGAEDPERRALAITKQAQELKEQDKAQEGENLVARLATEYETALRTRPNDAILWFGLARLQLHLEQEAAPASLATAMRLQPNNGRMHGFKGWMLCRQRDFVAAEVEFKRAIELAPRDSEIRIGYACCLASRDRTAEAEAQASESVKLDARNVEAVMIWSMLLCNLGKQEEAIGTLTAAVELNPKDLKLRELLAAMHWAAQRPLDAYAQLAEVRKLTPDSIDNEAKLIVLASQLRNSNLAEFHIARLRELQQAQKKTEESFARDDFFVGKRHVMVEEYFEPAGEVAFKYAFHIEDQREQSEGEIAILSTDVVNQRLREQGKLKGAERAWCVCWIRNGDSQTYQISLVPLGYEAARALAIEIMEGKHKPFPSAPKDPPPLAEKPQPDASRKDR